MDKIDYSILTDDAEIVDGSKNKTHESIAENLYGLISDSNTPGLTIGLEGKWGSGKSTVIKILSEKLRANTDTFIFYIDTWAHEGDPLRRIFLESFLEDVEKLAELKDLTNIKDLKELRSKIQYRKKTTVISKLPKFDVAGRVTASLAFLVPLGTVIIDHTYSNLTFNKGHPLYWEFIFGCLLIIAPMIASLIFTKLEKPFFKTKDVDKTTEISNEEEKSSVDFNNYFAKLQKILSEDLKIHKIVCVIDNLDRINESDALKIWSTLQTFVQGKNSRISSQDNTQKLFVIVPYDEQGLRKLWDGKNAGLPEQEKSSTKQNRDVSCSNSFFNKNFQLRVYVPQLIVSDWEDFAKKQIAKALVNYSEQQRTIVLNILQCTRKSLGDAPTLREIKIYVNQVAFLYPLHKQNASLYSLCYYVVLKYLKFKDYDEILTGLVNGTIPDASTEIYINRQDLTKELCSILFMVAKDDGMQLLLQDKIQKALIGSPTDLKALYEIHGESFFIVLNYVLAIAKELDIQKVTENLYYFLVENNKDKLQMLYAYVAETSVQDKILYNLCKYSENFWKIYIELIQANDVLINKLNIVFTENANKVENYINPQESENDFCWILYTVITALAEKCSITLDYKKVYYVGVETIYKKLQEKAEKLVIRINNLDSFDDDISKQITDEKSDKVLLRKMIRNLISINKVNLWTNSVTAVYDNLKATSMNKDIMELNLNILKEFQYCKYSQELAEKTILLLKNGTFWNNVYFVNESELKYVPYYLLYKYIEDLDAFQVQQTGNSQSSLNEARNTLKNVNENIAEIIYNLSELTNDYEIYWKLAQNPTNKLLGNIIILAASKQNQPFFAYPNPYTNLRNALRLVDKEQKSVVVKAFIAHSELENKLIEDGYFDYVENPVETIVIITETQNQELIKSLTDEILSTKEEVWTTVFKSKPNVLDVPVYLAQKNKQLALEADFYNAFVKYAIQNISAVNLPAEKLTELFNLLGKSWEKEFSVQMEKKLYELKFVVPEPIKNFCQNILKLEYIIEEHKTGFSDLIREKIETKKIEELQFIVELINNAVKKFVPDERYAEVLKKSVQSLSDLELKGQLAKIFSIEFDEVPPAEK